MKPLRLSTEEIGTFCLSLSHLFHAGIGTGDALSLLAEDETHPATKKQLETMAQKADYGTPLSIIFREAECFPAYVCGLLEVGERVGRTEETLAALAAYYENRARMEHRLRSALLYPSVLLLVLLAVVTVLLIWVLPIFNDVYLQLGSRLTGVAGGLLALGSALRHGMPLLCAVLVLVVLLVVLTALLPDFRKKILVFRRSRWGDRGISRKINEARFAQALSLGLSSGLNAQEAVHLATSLSDNTPGFDLRCNLCLDGLDRGESLPTALRDSGLLPQAECRLLEAGLRSGSVETVMTQIAVRLLTESEEALESQVSRIEPTLVVIMSVLVGLILFSVMLPLTHIMTAIG